MADYLIFPFVFRNKVHILSPLVEELTQKGLTKDNWNLQIRRYTPNQDHRKEWLVLYEESTSLNQFAIVHEGEDSEFWSSSKSDLEPLAGQMNQRMILRMAVTGHQFTQGDLVIQFGQLTKNGQPTRDILFKIGARGVHMIRFGEENLRSLYTSMARSFLPEAEDLQQIDDTSQTAAAAFFEIKGTLEKQFGALVSEKYAVLQLVKLLL
jgi:hypothetical protein